MTTVVEGIQIFKPTIDAVDSYPLEDGVFEKIFASVGSTPVAIVSICGVKSSGKSLLFRLLIRYFSILEQSGKEEIDKNFKESILEDFDVGIDFGTNGLLFWSRPFYIETESYSEVAVFFVDTQGVLPKCTSACKKEQLIIDFCTVVSSMQLFNIKQEVKREDLQCMKMFMDYGEKIEEASLNPVNPHAVLLLRDWCSPDRGLSTGQKHMEAAFKKLAQQGVYNPNHLKKAFGKLGCYTLPNIAKLNEVASAKSKKRLDGDFVESFCFLASYIHNNLVVKDLVGGPACGTSIVDFAKETFGYLKNVKRDSLLEKLIENTAHVHLYNKVDKAKSTYKQIMGMKCNPEKLTKTEMLNFHDEAKVAALAIVEHLKAYCCPIFLSEQLQSLRSMMAENKESYMYMSHQDDGDPNSLPSQCRKAIKDSAKLYRDGFKDFETRWVTDEEFQSTEQKGKNMAEWLLMTKLQTIIPVEELYMQTIRLQVKLQTIKESVSLRINARQRRVYDKFVIIGNQCVDLYRDRMKASFPDYWISSKSLLNLHKKAIAEVGKRFAQAFDDFEKLAPLYARCLKEFMESIEVARSEFEAILSEREVALHSYYAKRISEAFREYKLGRIVPEDWIENPDSAFHYERSAQIQAVALFIKDCIQDDQVSELLLKYLDTLIHNRIEPESKAFWKKLFKEEHDSHAKVDEAVEKYREQMRECFSSSSPHFDSLHKKAVKAAKKVITSSRFWSVAAMRPMVEASFDKSVSSEKYRFEQSHKFVAQQEEKWMKSIVDIMKSYGDIMTVEASKCSTLADFRKKHDQAVSSAMSKLNGGKKGNKETESKFKSVLTELKAKYERVSEMERIVKTLSYKSTEYERLKKYSNTTLLSFLPPNELFYSGNFDDVLCYGRSSTVRRARSNTHGQVAVKCYPVSGRKEEISQQMKTFMDEIEIFHVSSHVNVIEVLGYTCWEGFMGVVTEYAAGGNLKSLLLQSTNQPPDRFISMLLRLRFCADIASGLAFLQSSETLSLPKLSADDVLLNSDFRCKIAFFKFSSAVNPSMYDVRVNTRDFAFILHTIVLLSEPGKEEIDTYPEEHLDANLEKVERIFPHLTEQHEISSLQVMLSEMRRAWTADTSLLEMRDRITTAFHAHTPALVHAAVAALSFWMDIKQFFSDLTYPLYQLEGGESAE